MGNRGLLWAIWMHRVGFRVEEVGLFKNQVKVQGFGVLWFGDFFFFLEGGGEGGGV